MDEHHVGYDGHIGQDVGVAAISMDYDQNDHGCLCGDDSCGGYNGGRIMTAMLTVMMTMAMVVASMMVYWLSTSSHSTVAPIALTGPSQLYSPLNGHVAEGEDC